MQRPCLLAATKKGELSDKKGNCGRYVRAGRFQMSSLHWVRPPLLPLSQHTDFSDALSSDNAPDSRVIQNHLLGSYRPPGFRSYEPNNLYIYPSIDHSMVLLTYLLIRLLALFLVSWLGSASDHRPHTPTTTIFQYTSNCLEGLAPMQSFLIPLMSSDAFDTCG